MRPLILVLAMAVLAHSEEPVTYAEKLGWQKADRVLILHMDDAGMSYDSDIGIEKVLEKGAAQSLSVMMPTPWVPPVVRRPT